MCSRYKIGSESEHKEQDLSVPEGSGFSKGEYHETTYQPSRSKRPSKDFQHAGYPNHSRIPRPTTNELSDIDTRGSSPHEADVHDQGHFYVRNRHDGMTAAHGGDQHGIQNKTKNPAPGRKDPFATPPGRPSDEGARIFHIDDDSTDYPILTHDGTTDQPNNVESLMPVDAGTQVGKPQIVRKVNSGFQILAPGTFDVPIQIDAGRKEGVPGNKRQSRKLQKRSRANSYSIEEP